MSSVDCYDSLIGLEVRARRICFGCHPHALTFAGDGFRSAQVSQDDVAVKVSIIDILSWSVEASPAAHYTLSLLVLTFFQV